MYLLFRKLLFFVNVPHFQTTQLMQCGRKTLHQNQSDLRANPDFTTGFGWAHYLTSLILSFLVHEMGIILSILWGHCEEYRLCMDKNVGQEQTLHEWGYLSLSDSKLLGYGDVFQEKSFTHRYHSRNMWLDRKSPNSRSKTEMAIASGLMFFGFFFPNSKCPARCDYSQHSVKNDFFIE